MAQIEGVDYAWSRPDPAGLYKAGKRFASRYLSYLTTGKNLTIAERDRLWAAGLSVVLNWENTAGAAAQGFSVGVQHAREALRQATALGAPSSLPIYFSVDFNPSSSQWQAIGEYFRGVRSIIGLGRTGIYGGLSTMDHAMAGGWASWFWQTYAWSGGIWRAGIHVRQYRNGVVVAGGDVDLDTALVDRFGQWGPPQGGGDVSLHEVQSSNSERYHQSNAAMTDTVVGIGDNAGSTDIHVPNLLVQTVKRIEGKIDALANGGIDQAALAEDIADRVIAADSNPLGEADKPVIVEAVKDALRSGTGS